MRDARHSRQCFRDWLSVGGDRVLESYGTTDLCGIPDKHWEFLSTRLVPHYQTREHLFVHANLDPELDLHEQPDDKLYWDSAVERPRHKSGRTMYCGHTPQRDGIPLDMGHAVCIDTAACRGGWLTCVDVDARYCWQANEKGESRSFSLDEVPAV